MSINIAILAGEISSEVELRKTQNNKSVVGFNLITEKMFNEKTFKVYHKVIAWGNLADFISGNYQKGDKVLIQGSIENRSYEKDGVKRYVTEINAREVSPMTVVQTEVTYDTVAADQDFSDVPF